MKLVAGKDGEESGDKSDDKSDDKSASSDDVDQNRLNGEDNEKNDEKTDDKPTNEAEDSKDDANESTSAKDDHSTGNHNSSSNANEENGSNEEEKVDEEFSGSRRYAKRSVTTSDYFRPYRTNSKMQSGSLGRANDKSLKMASISRMNDKLMASSCSYCNRRSVKREDHIDHDFGDSGEVVYPRSVYVNKRRAAAFERSRRLRRPVSLERRKKIVSFDDPPDNYEKRNFDTAASHNEEDFDFSTDRRSPSRAGRTRNRKAFRSLKEEYDDAFGLKPVRPDFERSPRMERRKCSSNSARLKRTHRLYGGRDDTDFYSRLWKNPMYKKYQYI